MRIALCLLFILAQAFAWEEFYCGDEFDCYEVLKVSRTASQPEIKAAYKALSLEYHPDKQSDDPKVKDLYLAVRQAWDILSIPESRAKYDYILEHPQESYANYARHYTKNMQTNPIFILIGLFALVTVCDFLYRHKRYLDLQATVRRDPKVKNLIKDAKRDLLEKLKKADLPSAPGAKKKKKMELSDIPDTDIRLEDIGIVLSGSYSQPPEWTSLLPYRLLFLPMNAFFWLAWICNWTIRYQLLNQPFSHADREYLTCKVLKVSDESWNETLKEEREMYVQRELWIPSNLEILKAENKKFGAKMFPLLNRKVVSEKEGDYDVEW